MMNSASGVGGAGVISPVSGSNVGALTSSGNDVATLQSSVGSIGDAGTARGFLTAQLAAFANSAAPVDQDLPTLTASIRVETAKISALVDGNTTSATTLTRELISVKSLKGSAEKKLTKDHADIADLVPLNSQLDAVLDAYFQGKAAAPKLAWMHAATTTIVQALATPLNVAPAAVDLGHVADAVKALREFDRAFQALRLSVPDADDEDGTNRYSAFETARRGAVENAVAGSSVDFATAMNNVVTSLISKCKADEAGIHALISISNDPNVPGSAVDSHGNIKFSAIQKLKSLIPALSAENVLRLYQELDRATGPLNQDYIRGALADQLTVLGTAAVAGAAGNLAGVRTLYTGYFRELGLPKPNLGDDAAILGLVTAKLTEAGLTMASIMTYYADEAPRLLGPLHREALEAIEAKLDTLAAPEPLEVDTFVQFVNHLREFHVALTGDDAAATDKMTALLGQITPFLPAAMTLENITAIHDEITNPDDQALLAEPLAGPLVADIDTPAALLAAHVALGDLCEDVAVKAVLTSRLSVLAGEDPSDDADAYIAFVTDFHAAYTALSPDGFAVIGAAKLPDDLDINAIMDINIGLADPAPNALAVVRPILIRRVLVSLDARVTLTDIVQTYVPVLEALGLEREEDFARVVTIFASKLPATPGGLALGSKLPATPAGLAEQFRGLGDDQAALRDHFVEALMKQAAAAPPEGASNEATQARIQSFLDASLTISWYKRDRNRILTALMTHIAQVLTSPECVALYTHLTRADDGLAADGALRDVLRAPLATRVWEQAIGQTAAGFAGSVNRLRTQLVNLGGPCVAVAALNIATLLPADLTTEDIKAIYGGLDAVADRAAVRDDLVIQRVALYNALPAAQTARLFIECVKQLAADLRALEIAYIPPAVSRIDFASKLPPETVEMTPADVDGIIAAFEPPLGYISVVPRLIKAIESYLGRGNANVAASLASLRRALGHSEDDAKAIIINKLPVADRLAALTALPSTPELVTLIVSGVPPATTAEFKTRIELFESVLGKLEGRDVKGQFQSQSSLLATANSFLSNPDNLNDQALLTLLPRMGKLLGNKVAKITFPEGASVKLAINDDRSSSLSSVQIRVLDTLASMKYQGDEKLEVFRSAQLNEFKRARLTLSKSGRHSGHTVDRTSEVVQGIHNYDAKAVDAFLEMASGLAHIENTELQIGLLAELKHLVTKMTKGETGRTLAPAQLTKLMEIMETSARAIPAAAAAPKPDQATDIRSDFLETMRLLGSDKALNAAPKNARPELRSRHSAIMAMALAQGGAGEAAAESTPDSSGDLSSEASASSGSPNSPKGFLPLSSISPADTTRLVAIYRGKFSGAGTASEKFGPIVSLAGMLKEAVASKATDKDRTVVMDLLMATIDAASKANDFNTALQLVPFLRPLMRLKVDGGKIADVYGTRIATLLRSCASQPNAALKAEVVKAALKAEVVKAALKAEVVKAATDLALETNDYPSKSWEQARRVLTLGLAGPLKLSGRASASTTCGEQTVMLLAKLAKDKSSVVEEAAKDGLFQLYSSCTATMGGAESDKMRHMVKIGMKDAGLGDSASSFMPNGAIQVGTGPNLAIRAALDGVRKVIIPETGDANLALEFVGQLRTLNPSSDLRPRAVAMMLDEVTKRVMTGGNGDDKHVVALLGFVEGIALSSSEGLTYAPRERLMALQTLRVLYPLMDTGVQGEIKDIFKEIMQGEVTATGAAEFEQLRAQATAALAWSSPPAAKLGVEGASFA